MFQATTFVRLALIAVTLAVTPLTASAVEADISGTITGGIDVQNGYAYGRGELPHLGKTGLNIFPIIFYSQEDPIYTMDVLGPLRLTAANGDYVYADCGPTQIDEAAGELSWEVTFDGGTSRFGEATGAATLVFRMPPQYWLDGGYGYWTWYGEFELIDARVNY
jgi:hypothetical protein